MGIFKSGDTVEVCNEHQGCIMSIDFNLGETGKVINTHYKGDGREYPILVLFPRHGNVAFTANGRFSIMLDCPTIRPTRTPEERHEHSD